MSVKIHIPTPLRTYVEGQDEVEIGSNFETVESLFSELILNFPNLKSHLYDDGGSLRGYVNIYVNDEDIRFVKQEKTSLKAGDEVSIVPSIAGG